MNLKNHSTKPSAKMSTLQLSTYGGADITSRQMYYAFGSVMPNSNNLDAASHTYGFNGKENLNEISGNGNELDFGERMYNSRLNRWFAVDKEFRKAPGWSPYRFGFDNPIYYADGDGNFEIPIHILITQAVAKAFDLSAITSTNLVKGNVETDSKGFLLDLHFDGRDKFVKVNNTFRKLIEKINTLDVQKDAYDVGQALHTLQDFYSHSNYVELYIEYYNNKGGDISKLKGSDIPLYQEGVEDEMFRKKYLEPRLRTGDWDNTSNEKIPWTDKTKLGENTHYQINKDSNESLHGKEFIGKGSSQTYHDVARGIAIRATVQVVGKLLKGVPVKSAPRFW